MTQTLSRFLTASALLWAGFGAGSDALAQTAGITPKVGINLRTPEYTLDVNGGMRVADIDYGSKISTHLLAVDKDTRQVKKIAAAQAGAFRLLEITVEQPGSEDDLVRELTTTEINPLTHVGMLLRVTLETTYFDRKTKTNAQNHNQKLLTLVDDPNFPDLRNHLLPASFKYDPNNRSSQHPDPTRLIGRPLGSTDQLQLATSMGKDAEGQPRPNTLLITTKQFDLRLNEAQTNYVLSANYGRAMIANIPKEKLRWKALILVIDKRWANESDQVVRVAAGGQLLKRDGSPYAPFYTTDQSGISVRPKPSPIDLSANALTGTATPQGKIRVTKVQEGNRSELPEVQADADGLWSVPTGALTQDTYFEVAQVQSKNGQELPISAKVKVIVRSHPLDATTDLLGARVEGNTQDARDRVAIGKRNPEKTLDVVGNWGLRQVPEYPYSDAALLAVEDGVVPVINRFKAEKVSIYAFNLGVNHPDGDWVGQFYMNKVNSNEFEVFSTKPTLGKTVRLPNGKLASFNPDDPDASSCYLGVTRFYPSMYNAEHRTLLIRSGLYKENTYTELFHTSEAALTSGNGSPKGNYDKPMELGAILFPTLAITRPNSTTIQMNLDYNGTGPMGTHTVNPSNNRPRASTTQFWTWRVPMIAIRRGWTTTVPILP